MGVLTLNILFREKGVTKTMQFDPRMVVYDACRLIRDKVGPLSDSPNNYGLFRVEDDAAKCVWMENGRSLEYYLIRNGDTLEYRNKVRQLRVRTLDGGAVKTLYVDESQPVSQLMITVCSKMGIANHEEYSLVRSGDFPPPAHHYHDGSATNGYHHKEASRGRDSEPPSGRAEGGGGGNTFMNTIGRKKERQIQQLRAKLHTDDEIQWVDQSKTLREQGIDENEELILRRKYFFSDTNVDTRDPVQLNLLYLQCRDGVLKGLHPVSRETAIKLAALQCHIEYGPFQEGVQRSIDAKDLLPKEYAKAKEHEKNIVQEYRELIYEDQAAPKKKYCELCQSLPTYGVTFFLVKEKLPGKNRLIPRLLGINKESVMRVDEKTKAVLKEWPLEQVRRWAASYKTFTLDFGDYKDGYYSVQTQDGERIGQLIGGYIDIIMKKKRTADHTGIEGDEGSTLLEDVVAPARATLIAHGELERGYAHDGHVALPGVLRSAAGTPSDRGLQYGAVGGKITVQDLPRGERPRYVDSQERSQRALIGTIEATIRAVEEAEEEISKPPQIDLPHFEDSVRHWKVEVEKESIGDRLAAMGAATAEVVQLTAIPEESDSRVGIAITTIGSNLPEMGRSVRDVAAMMPDESRAGDLVEAARRLCGAFGNFLDKVHPERHEKRATILSAASRVGELSHEVINTMQEQTTEERTFHEQLNQKARSVATSTAKLVLQAKTVSADCTEPALKEQVIHSAMKTAYATSELIACTRVVGPTIDRPQCKEHLTAAAHGVARAVEDLLHDANGACKRTASGTGEQQYGDLHSAARQVSQALDELIDHVKLGPGGDQQQYQRRTQQDYSYEQVLQSSNRIITQQGPDANLMRDSESAIRHSRLLVDEFENEAERSGPDQRDRLLNAARTVAQATSNMIDATKECQTRPHEAESQMALRSAAEQLVQVTNEATSGRLLQQSVQRLERTARDACAAATQNIAASNAARQNMKDAGVACTVFCECAETSRYIPPVVQAIKESQAASDPGEQFRAHSTLIYEASQVVAPASRLVEVSRQAIPNVQEPHTAQRLQTTSQELSTQLAELRVALNNAQQLRHQLQLDHSEDLIRELDRQLQEIGHQGKRRTQQQRPMQPPAGWTAENAGSFLSNSCREVGSGAAQLVATLKTTSSDGANEKEIVGAAAAELARALYSFANAVHGVVATREDVAAESFVLNARSVVHDSGRVFDRVRERDTTPQLQEATRMVDESLGKLLSCLPDNAAVEQALERLNQIGDNQQQRPAAAAADVEEAAAGLVDATSSLIVGLKSHHQVETVDVFVTAFECFYFSVVAVGDESDPRRGGGVEEQLQAARERAADVLRRYRSAQSDINNVTHIQSLEHAKRQLVESVSVTTETVLSVGGGSSLSAWARECDSALQRIASVRYVLEERETLLPLNNHSYYESLAEVTNQARNLGDGMNGMAHYARCENIEQLCLSVRTVASAVCGLAESAAQSAYLIGAGDPASKPGRPVLFDVAKCTAAMEEVKRVAQRLERGDYTRAQIINDATVIAGHTSTLANICREASEASSSVNAKRQFVACARDITSATTALIQSVRRVDQSSPNGEPAPQNDRAHTECRANAGQLRSSVDALERFIVGNTEFAALPVQISEAGQRKRLPVLQSTRQMLDASSEMIATAKDLESRPTDAAIWQRIASNSSVVSDSIKQLVATIRDEAPGQADLDAAIQRLNQLIQELDSAPLASDAQHQQASQSQRSPGASAMSRQQILHSTHEVLDRIAPLSAAAIGHAESIGHSVHEHMRGMENVVASTLQAAAQTPDSAVQNALLDQCKTVIEAELQMMFATKDSGGNPKAVELHSIVEESAQQLHDALADLQRYVALLDSDAGVVHGIVETISRSITLADQTRPTPQGDSFADTQTRMVDALNEISQLASDMPLVESAEVEALGQMSLRLAERYRDLVDDLRVAQNLLTSANLSQKLKVSVQRLGTACTELVKVAGQRRQHSNDYRLHNQLGESADTVVARVREVLAALNEGSRGTQACINAAQTVSGIIGDLDTTIMVGGGVKKLVFRGSAIIDCQIQFATSGSLNPQAGAQRPAESEELRDVIVKTAKALVEDTKALVSGAASNQEQLAVAAQNAVRTILHLTEAVKGGAAEISPDSGESQIMIIHAVRDVAASLANLIQATKHASGRSPNDPAIAGLKESAKLMVTSVSSLLRTIKAAEDAGQRGLQALETAVGAIDAAVQKYDSGSEVVTRHGSGALASSSREEVLRAARAVTDATAKATSAASSMQQEAVIASANLARQAVGELLHCTRAAALSAESPELKYRMLNCGRDVALQVKHLLATLQTLLVKPNDNSTKAALLHAAKEIADTIGNLALCSEQLRIDWGDSSGLGSPDAEPTVIAERELLGAAHSIEAASLKLAQLRPRVTHSKPEENLSFDEQILSAAKSIAKAVQTLVQAAGSAQRELVAQGRITSTAQLATRVSDADYQWSEGLISAARMVAAAVHQLCEAANGLVQGHSTEEKLISAAKQVASSTAHLLVACKVKADLDSRAMQRLQTAGHAVKTATEQLVNAARQTITDDERALVISDRLVTGIAQVMDAQEVVLRKERELVEARNRLAAINKSRYEKSPEPT